MCIVHILRDKHHTRNVMCNEKMSRNVRHLEILLGIVICIIGILLTWFGVLTSIEHYDFMQTHPERADENYSPIKMYGLLLIVPLFLVISGILLVARKKMGWISSISLSAHFALMWLIFGLIDNMDFEYAWVIYVFSAIFFIITFVLLSKPYRKYYNPTPKTWTTIIVSCCSLLAYRFLFYI